MRISDWSSDVCSSDLWNNNYLSGSADWVNFETTVSTSSGQIALAPGYLQRKWTKDGRNYFAYKSEAKLLPFFSWLSADWQVRRDRSEEHTSELQSLMRISYAVFCLKKKTITMREYDIDTKVKVNENND